MKEKVILAYSGGLDTTAIIPWLKETYGYEVICCCVDCGQEEELNGLDERAKLSGASKLYIEDIVDEFCDDYIVPCVQANAVYENKYLLGTSMARPGIHHLSILSETHCIPWTKSCCPDSQYSIRPEYSDPWNASRTAWQLP